MKETDIWSQSSFKEGRIMENTSELAGYAGGEGHLQ